jgi:hypothetical protein
MLSKPETQFITTEVTVSDLVMCGDKRNVSGSLIQQGEKRKEESARPSSFLPSVFSVYLDFPIFFFFVLLFPPLSSILLFHFVPFSLSFSFLSSSIVLLLYLLFHLKLLLFVTSLSLFSL